MSKESDDSLSIMAQAMKQRNSRTLSIRRSVNPSIAMIICKQKGRKTIFEKDAIPQIDLMQFLEVFNSNDPVKIISMCNLVLSSQKDSLRDLFRSTEATEAFALAMGQAETVELQNTLLQTLIQILPHCVEKIEEIVDADIASIIFGYTFTESEELIGSLCQFISLICSLSDYARDSLICLGVHEKLIEIALNNGNMCQIACLALNSIFANATTIDNEVLVTCLEPIYQLLQDDNMITLHSVLTIFSNITNQIKTLSGELYQKNLHIIAVNSLSNEDLIEPALKLIGNLCVSSKIRVKEMIDHGLLESINELMSTIHTSDVLWILSNLVEFSPSLIAHTFSDMFILQIIEIAQTSSFEIKKEGVFFLSTLTIYGTIGAFPVLFNQDVIDLMVEILGCGDETTILRCIDGLSQFVLYVQTAGGAGTFAEMLGSTDIGERIDELSESQLANVVERSQHLGYQISMLTQL